MTARALNSPRYSLGYEWTNRRGQVFVQMPDHPSARADGFVPRSKLAMEQKIGRYLLPPERVYHVRQDDDGDWVDGDPGDDRPECLWLFPTQKELSQHRSLIYHAKKERRGGGWSALTPAQREWQEARVAEALRTKEWEEANRAEELRLERLRAAVARRKAAKEKKPWGVESEDASVNDSDAGKESA